MAVLVCQLCQGLVVQKTSFWSHKYTWICQKTNISPKKGPCLKEMSPSQVDIRSFSGETFSRKRKTSPEGVGKLVAIVGFMLENEQQKRHILRGGFKHFLFLHRKKLGVASILASIFLQMGCNQYVYVCFGSGSLNRNHVGILPLGGGWWSMSNHLFFSTQDISFEASGCALRVSWAPYQDIWKPYETKKIHKTLNMMEVSDFHVFFLKYKLYLFQSKRKEQTWNKHGVFIVERWKISWKDFYPVQVDRAWFVCWLYLNYVYVVWRKYSNVLHISDLIWSLQMYVYHIFIKAWTCLVEQQALLAPFIVPCTYHFHIPYLYHSFITPNQSLPTTQVQTPKQPSCFHRNEIQSDHITVCLFSNRV